MAFWQTVKTKDGCYRQQMSRGFVNGVWTTYAVSGAYPCDDNGAVRTDPNTNAEEVVFTSQRRLVSTHQEAEADRGFLDDMPADLVNKEPYQDNGKDESESGLITWGIVGIIVLIVGAYFAYRMIRKK